MIVNWGVPGVGVYRVGGDAEIEIWATTPEAAGLQRAQAVADGHIPEEDGPLVWARNP